MDGTTLDEPRAAGLVGYISTASTAPTATYSITNSTVENCTITGSNGAAGVLGLVDNSDVTIDGCAVKGKTAIKCTEDRGNGAAKAGNFVGTVSSNATVTIKNATVDTTVTLTNVNAIAPVYDKLVGRVIGGTVIVD